MRHLSCVYEKYFVILHLEFVFFRTMHPKIKVRLPKWQHVFSSSESWPRELLMTFIGTTLSIILTFGTAGYLERKQQRADGRQTAMMVIHDMESTADHFSLFIKYEEERFMMTQYVIEHIDRIESIRWDTLSMVLSYITQTKKDPYRYDDSNEKIFLSSQDVWKNIDNPMFIDQVQHFFYMRRYYYDGINASALYTQPVSMEEVYQFIREQQSITFPYDAFLVERLKRPEVVAFVEGSAQRQREFNTYMTDMQAFAKRCKFMMEISDKELHDYVVLRQQPGHRLKERDLIGTWRSRDDSDLTEQLEFRKDHTFLSTATYHISHQYYIGRLDAAQINKGTWRLDGDSLFLEVNSDFEYRIDDSHITYIPSREKDVQLLIEDITRRYQEAKQEAAAEPAAHIAERARIDGLGNKIELKATDPESDKAEYEYWTRVQ